MTEINPYIDSPSDREFTDFFAGAFEPAQTEAMAVGANPDAELSQVQHVDPHRRAKLAAAGILLAGVAVFPMQNLYNFRHPVETWHALQSFVGTLF